MAFVGEGSDYDLRDLAVRNLGKQPFFSRNGQAREFLSAEAYRDYSQFNELELDMLLRFEHGFYQTVASFDAWVQALISTHEIVTCEYPFMAQSLAEACKRQGRKLVLTSHDSLHELHASHALAKKHMLQAELRSMRLADTVVFCNETERRCFEQHGIKGLTVLNTGDARSIEPGIDKDADLQLRKLIGITTPHYCLFVGSKHLPNVEALPDIKALAAARKDIAFVVVGECCPRSTEGNFHSLGRVTDTMLDNLYRGACAIIVPLHRGTGSSLKVYQALSYAKVVISTTIGARGYELQHDRELIIADSGKDFLLALDSVITDSARRQRIETAAREYALRLDYRTHFKPYADAINALLGRSNVQASAPARTLIVADNNLLDKVGHHYNYALSLRHQCEALGIPFQALVKNGARTDILNDLNAQPVFSLGIHEESPANPFPSDWGMMRGLYGFLLSNVNFAAELEQGLARRARPGDVVLIPNATPNQMLGLALALRRTPILQSLRFVLILRFSVIQAMGPLSSRRPFLNKESAERYGTAIKLLRETDYFRSVTLTTDSNELANEFRQFSELPVSVLPIPHTINEQAGTQPADVPCKNGCVRVVYMGDAREEKGFELLPGVVRACAGSQLKDKAEFVFQSFISSPYHLPMQRSIDELEALGHLKVRLIKGALSEESYQHLLASADLVLLPYDNLTYKSRTSGPFMEALCAGKPVVIPQDSWMSTQLGKSGAGTTFISGNKQDFERAALQALQDLPRCTRAAQALGAELRAFHNPASFVQRLFKT